MSGRGLVLFFAAHSSEAEALFSCAVGRLPGEWLSLLVCTRREPTSMQQEEQATWEPEENLAADLIDAYKSRATRKRERDDNDADQLFTAADGAMSVVDQRLKCFWSPTMQATIVGGFFRETEPVTSTAAALREACASTTSTKLTFLGPLNVIMVVEGLRHNRSFKTVLFESNATTLSVKVIAEALEEHESLTTITLFWDVGDVGVAALAQLIARNRRIRELKLIGGTRLNFDALCQAGGSLTVFCASLYGVIDAQPFATLIATSQNLREMDLCANRFGNAGARLLAQALTQSQTRLRSLDLSRCGIDRDGGLMLVDAIETGNFALTNLNLGGDVKDADVCERLQRVLIRNGRIQAAIRAAMYALIGCAKRHLWLSVPKDVWKLIFPQLIMGASAWQYK